MRVEVVVFILLLAILPQPSLIKDDDVHIYPLREMRALWVPRWDACTKEKIDSVVSLALECNFNAIFIQVVGEGYSLYNSSINPKYPYLDKDFDALKYTIQICKEKKIEVHAWVNMFAVGTKTNFEKYPSSHILKRHPEWRVVDRYGNYDDGSYSYICLDPGREEVKVYLKNVVEEIVRNYDIDGIQMDYIRYKGIDYCYCEHCKKKYEEETGYAWSDGAKWDDWRRKQIENTVKIVYESVITLKPWIKVGCDVWGKYSNGYNYYFQDSKAFIEKGIVDYIAPMAYTNDDESFRSWVSEHISWKGKKHIYTGIGSYMHGEYGKYENTKNQIVISRNLGCEGEAIFAYSSLVLYPSITNYVKSVFDSKADIPKKNITFEQKNSWNFTKSNENWTIFMGHWESSLEMKECGRAISPALKEIYVDEIKIEGNGSGKIFTVSHNKKTKWHGEIVFPGTLKLTGKDIMYVGVNFTSDSKITKICIYDSTPPELKIYGIDENDDSVVGKINIKVDCEDLNDAEVEIYMDGNVVDSGNKHAEFTLLTSDYPEGSHEIKIVCKDSYGNTNEKEYNLRFFKCNYLDDDECSVTTYLNNEKIFCIVEKNDVYAALVAAGTGLPVIIINPPIFPEISAEKVYVFGTSDLNDTVEWLSNTNIKHEIIFGDKNEIAEMAHHIFPREKRIIVKDVNLSSCILSSAGNVFFEGVSDDILPQDIYSSLTYYDIGMSPYKVFITSKSESLSFIASLSSLGFLPLPIFISKYFLSSNALYIKEMYADCGISFDLNNESLYLNKGWNLVSIPLYLDYPYTSVIWHSVPKECKKIFSYYDDWSSWSSNSTDIEDKKISSSGGVWLYCYDDCVWEVCGRKVTIIIDVKKGWNLIGTFWLEGYKNQIFGIDVKLYAWEDGEFKEKRYVEKGKGYWLYSSEDFKWEVVE